MQQAASNREAATLSMTTSTAGLLENLHQNLLTQPSNGDPTNETIQAVHWDPNSSPAFDQPLHVSQQQQNAPFVVSSAPFSGESAAHSNNAGYTHRADMPGSPRPLFTVMVETDCS